MIWAYNFCSNLTECVSDILSIMCAYNAWTLPSIERHLSRWDGTCSITICILMWNFRSSKGIFFVWNLNKWWRGIKFCTSKVKHFEFIEHNFFVKWIFKWVFCFTFFFPKEFKVLRVLYGLIFYQVHPLIKILLFVICHHMIVCNWMLFAIRLVVFVIIKLVLYNFWVVQLCVQLKCN